MLEILETPITVLHIIVSLFVVLIVLLQPGKSGGIGAALGGAGAQQVFGGRGAGNFLSKLTWASAGIFFLTSMLLAYVSSSTDDSLAERANRAVVTPLTPEEIPAAGEPAAGEPAADEPAADEPAAESASDDAAEEGAEDGTGPAPGAPGEEAVPPVVTAEQRDVAAEPTALAAEPKLRKPKAPAKPNPSETEVPPPARLPVPYAVPPVVPPPKTPALPTTSN